MSNTLANRRVTLASAANMRDLGGLPLSEGIFTPDKVFRSASLAQLSDPDQQVITQLGITVVYDLRTTAERQSQPDRLPSGIDLVGLDVLADGQGGIADAVGTLAVDPAKVNALLGGNKVQDMLTQTYRSLVTLPSAHASYRELFQGIATPERDGAVLFHCTAGKDRTGWAAASLLLLLGAEEATVQADYLQTNDDLLPTIGPILEGAAAKGVDPDLIREAFSVRASYLDAAQEEVASKYGTIEDYFVSGVGLSASTIDTLRDRLISPSN